MPPPRFPGRRCVDAGSMPKGDCKRPLAKGDPGGMCLTADGARELQSGRSHRHSTCGKSANLYGIT
ncbi:hypothetical protein GCM10027359_26410 [Marilutibacter aestuarii]